MLSILRNTVSRNRKAIIILLASFILVIAVAIFVLSLPPQIETERTEFSELVPNYSAFSDPQIVHLGKNVYFVWSDVTREDADILIRQSFDSGITFSPPENLSDNPGNSTDPQIATYGNTTYVVWQDNTDGNNEVYLKLSPAGKSEFGRIFNLSRNNGSSTDPHIATYGNTTYVVWQDNTDGNYDVSFANATSTGLSRAN